MGVAAQSRDAARRNAGPLMVSASDLSASQQAALSAMGIERWVLRAGPGDIDADHDPGAPAQAPVDTETDPQWTSLNASIRACTSCGLHESRTQAVCGVGAQTADCLIIGEAPGAEEDQQGEPFVGRAGQLLNQMLRAIGLSRQSVFIANILKCRPPNNRDPSAAESAACMPYLQKQIELLQPRLIVVVGRIAAQNLLDSKSPVGRLRGQVHFYGNQQIPVVVTYHPAYLLRSPAQKARSWEDLLLARDVLEGAAP